jgi:hypothetical protein
MSLRKHQLFLLVGLSLLFLAALTLMWPSADAQAQCGSQASSCKNCHEVQAKDPVNNDGTGWHVSHAFGDFCYLCHAGNNQSLDEAAAHTGMVPPLSDIKAGCQGCHPGDLNERAQVYASALGVSLEAGGSAPGTGSTPPSAAAPTAPEPEQVSEAEAPAMVVDSGEVVDYNQRYEEVVIGKRPINWGNVILVVLILMLLVVGGVIVYINERKRRGLPIGKTQAAPVSGVGVEAPVVEGYSPEVTALLPQIAKLNPIGLHALKRLLENPDNANELLRNISKLDPELVNRLRTLDRPSRELLLAMSGD